MYPSSDSKQCLKTHWPEAYASGSCQGTIVSKDKKKFVILVEMGFIDLN